MPRIRWPVVCVLLLALIVSTGYAQRRIREGVGRGGGNAARFRPAGFVDRSFSFCRLMYQQVRSEQSGIGWSTDYPYADRNLMIRVSELTKTPVSMDPEGEPNHWVVQATDDSLFDCPFVMASDAGTLGFRDAEIKSLRTYLLKGGFFWADDFWGTAAWEHWTSEIAKVLPPGEFPIVEVPEDHPVFRTLFQVSRAPQITNIQFWRQWGGRTTSERGVDSRDVHFRVIADRQGRIMVAMTHNTDIADSWEREGEDPEFFHQFSPDGYAFGINVLLYALTH